VLYENVNCDHLEGLETIMNSCDASILDDIPKEITKLSGRIVKRWWTSHGLPYTMIVFHVVPRGVRIFATCCSAWRLLILTISYVSI
jgi:hypothetical protein